MEEKANYPLRGGKDGPWASRQQARTPETAKAVPNTPPAATGSARETKNAAPSLPATRAN